MTSEVMILTKRFGILAADRQQTMADGKTYGGIRKIFELSRLHSAGIMINGNPDFQDVPIETLIAEFKFKTDFNRIETIEGINDELIDFLSKNTQSSSTEEYLEKTLKAFKDDLILEINKDSFDNVVSQKQRKDICPFIKRYPNFNNEFDDIIPDDKDRAKYCEILWKIFSFELVLEVTGIVISGFDLKSHYPSFFEIELYYNDNGKIIYEIIDSATNTEKPIVKVFAINQEAYTFITGVNDEFIDFILRYISDANKSIIENFRWNLENDNIENVDKIVEFLKKEQKNEYDEIENYILDFRLDTLEDTTYSIENLPEWLICLFADFLIKLAAIKQKTSSEIESVSIETDILTISKVDGLKWLNNDNTIV